MFKLYLGNEDEKRFIGKYKTMDEVRQMMSKEIKRMNFKCYYMRYNFYTETNLTVIDYGSHTQFFYVYEGSEK